LITKEYIDGLKKKRDTEHMSYRMLSRLIETETGEKIPQSTINDWLNGGFEKRKGKENIPVNEQFINSKNQFELDKNLVTARNEAAYYKQQYNNLVKDAAAIDKMIDVATRVTNAIPSIPVTYTPKLVKASSKQYIVAPLSDTHIGEKVNREEMAGLNSYNMDIFNKRLRGWAEEVVTLTGFRRTYANVPDLYVPMLGDMISGDIHLELMKTNADNAMGQMIRGANLISQALVYISSNYENVYVPCVVGNHGRMTQKPPAKEIYSSWDYLLYQWIAAYCKNQKNIHFSIPKSFLNVFTVAGKNILIMHGDSAKAWNGIPFYGLLRAIAQLRQVFQFRRGLEYEIEKLVANKATEQDVLGVMAEFFDSVMVGHFHNNSEIDIGTGTLFICPCMKGGDEYSFSKLHTISKPTQILTTWHPRLGYIDKEIIYLQEYDKSNNKFVDALPDIWADNIK